MSLTGLQPEVAGAHLRQHAEAALDAVTIFSGYEPEERRILLGYMSHYFIPTHHLLMQQGETGDSLWVLMPGSRATLHALENGQALQPTQVHGPNFFGELALRVEHAVNSTVQAEPGSQWLRLHNSDFQSFLRDYGQDLLDKLTLSPAAEHYLGQTHARRRYAWLQKGENLVAFQRRHWLALLRKVALSLVLSVLTMILWVVLTAQGWLGAWGWFGVAAAGFISLFSFVWGFVDYYNDYLLITNQRLVRQEKVIFFTENRQAAFLEQIRNIDTDVTFFGNLFGYGTLSIYTAAAIGSIDFDFVPEPADAQADHPGAAKPASAALPGLQPHGHPKPAGGTLWSAPAPARTCASRRSAVHRCAERPASGNAFASGSTSPATWRFARRTASSGANTGLSCWGECLRPAWASRSS